MDYITRNYSDLRKNKIFTRRTEQLSSCYKGEDKTLVQFSSLDKSKKADNPALEPILGCFHNLDESQRRSPYPELISQPDESKRAEKTLELAIHKSRAKELKRCLSSPCPKSVQAWMRVRRLKSRHSTYPRLFSWSG
jgi:hypothetical protein